MALPSAEQRQHLPVTALFLASSFAVAITAGFGLGTWLLLHASVGVPLPDTAWSVLVQVHGHAQLVGFAGLLVMGIGYRILPRFRGADDPPVRLVLASYALVATGLLIRPLQIWSDLPGRSALLFVSGGAELAGMLVYAGIVLRTLGSGENVHRADELFLGAGAVFGVVGAIWGLAALAPVIAGGTVADAAGDRAAIAALLLGFVAAHIIGVSLRVAPAFIGASPTQDRAVLIAAVAWTAGILATILGGPIGPLLLLFTAVALARAIVFAGPGAAVHPLPAPARVTRLAFRGAYVWLLVGLALLAAGSAGDATGALTTAARHALALGFLTQIVFGVGSRLVPALTGGPALPTPAVRTAIVLVNVAALLRVIFEIVGPGTTASAAALAASGPIALAALVIFALATARSVRSAISRSRSVSAPRRSCAHFAHAHRAHTRAGRSTMRDELVQIWVIHDLEILGWREMVGIRNVLAHGYFGIDIERVWTTVERDLPMLKGRIGSILAKMDDPADR